mgnify:CR=1 FL=1
MRVAHVTDIHVERRPSLAELGNKRLAGAVVLYLLGRSAHFSRAAQAALVQAVAALDVDVILCTGDLTATATEAEFLAAAALFAPLRSRPFLCLPGNHAVYTDESLGRYQRHFGDDGIVALSRHGAWDIVRLRDVRPDWLSRGEAGEAARGDLDRVLGDGDRPALVALHNPLRGRRAEPYGPATRALADAREVEAVLARHARVKLVVHGHEHHGYRTEIPREGGGIVEIDPGAGGYAHLPGRGRTAHFCVYTLGADAIEGVERFAFDGERFLPEAGGPFASGG